MTTFDDHLANQLLAQRVIFLGTEVSDESAQRVCAQLLVLSAEDPREDILLFINSPGGSITAGLAIYDTMRLIPNDVATVAAGLAASMGQVLLTVGAPGKRHALANARIMMHQPSAAIGGTAADVAIQTRNHEQMRRLLVGITAERTGRSRETVERDSERDRWFSAPEAREYGMVDEVLDSLARLRSPARSRIGL